MSGILKVENLQKIYGSRGNVTLAVNHISFEVKKGEFVGIMGPSGSGKTTLLNCISTIDRPTSGKIIIDGVDIIKLKKKALSEFRSHALGFVFQDFNLLDTLTGYENIALALTINRETPNTIESKVKEVAKYLDIEPILSKYPYQMSGGEKQRIASARAIVTEPKLVLADEPTGALDSKSAEKLLSQFQSLNENLKTTLLMVTHDAYSASYAERIIFVKDGDIFYELIRGEEDRRAFFNRIVEVVALMGGDNIDC